ncbi:MAG TPA: transcription antitermination factor NusB [Ktedonobacterales bacterium]|nr:transcription antitermination factor NusB [Ktedonobacterales bacterium]
MAKTTRSTRASQQTTRSRRQARMLALQTLYEYDTAGHDIDAVLARHITEQPEEQPDQPELTDETLAFASQLAHGALAHLEQIDERIHAVAPEWPLAQMAHIDKNILRLAIYEILYGISPGKVAINEAVELAKVFGSDASSRFVNGVLGAVYTGSQQPEAHDPPC